MTQNPRHEEGRRSYRLPWILVLAGSAAACSHHGDHGGTEPPEGGVGPGQTTTVTIHGPGATSVTVPPGASATAIAIAVSEDATGAPPLDASVAPVSPIVAVTPHGAQFSRPVTVRIPFDASRVPAGTPLMVLQAEPGGAWAPRTAISVGGDVAAVGVTSFSYFAVAPIPGTRVVQPLSLQVTPLDSSFYYSAAEARWLWYGLPDTRPVLIPVQVSVSGSPGCTGTERPELLVSAQATAPDGTTHSWMSPSSLGWPLTATEVELPMLPAYSWVDQYSPYLDQDYYWEFNVLVSCTTSGYQYYAYSIPRIVATSVPIIRMLTVHSYVALGVGGGPVDVSGAVGDHSSLATAVLGGTFFPTDSDQLTVEWLRSEDGGLTWLEASGQLAFETELPYDAHLDPASDGNAEFGAIPVHWSTLALPPLRPEDDGALFQAHACYTPPGTTTTDCAFSPAARVTVLSTSVPAFTADPQSVLVAAGSAATFTVAAAGAPTPTLTWQTSAPGSSTWTDLPGATGATYTTAALDLSSNGMLIRAVATNSVGSATSRTALVDVTPAALAPSIEVQPFDATVAPGATARFVVVARGSDPLAYQWRRDGAPLAGATGPRLDLPSVGAGDSGALLDVVVTNPAGSATSSAATLTVATGGPPPVAPTITTQPADTVVIAPYPVIFTVVASGTAPLSYQWLAGGVAIPGATSASYATGLTTPGGPPVTYSVVVWNAGGAVVSAGATLTVEAPVMAVQSVTPAVGSTGNPATATIAATFTALLDSASVDVTSFQLFEGANLVPGSATVAGATLTFVPTQPLPTRTTLHAHLASGLRDTVGDTLAAPYDWTFGMAPWTRQFGSAAHDEPLALRTDGAGNVLLAGYTAGGLAGIPLTGFVDAFAIRLAPSGTTLWTRQLGASGALTYAYGVGADAAGNVYVAGHTSGALPGNTSDGAYDLFLTKLDPSGSTLWTQQHGSGVGVQVAGLAVDADGNAFVAGWTQGTLDGQRNAGAEDVFVVKYDASGNRVWTGMYGSSATDYATSVALDATGNVLVAGYTTGSLGGTNAGSYDLFVLKLGPDGSLQWAQQLGSSQMDEAWGVASDLSGNVYVAGWTRGALDGQTSAGGQDIVVVKYDASGAKQWTRQLGTAADDWAGGVAVDANGGVYLAGGTHGPLDGGSNTTATQLFVAKLDQAGAPQWVFQEGAQAFGYDQAEAVALDPFGNVFAAGITDGGLDGNTSAGDYDAFVVKLRQDGTAR